MFDRGRRSSRTIRSAVALSFACSLAACASPVDALSSDGPSRDSSIATAPQEDVLVRDYLPGLAAELRSPVGTGSGILVVLVPGGGWASADPGGLVPLAETLTVGGATTSLITYSTTQTLSRFPTGVNDVACAIRWSVQQARDLGHDPAHTVVLGHSAGGHLAALVALSGSQFGSTCPYPAVGVDGLVGLAGIYDTDAIRPALSSWMGISADVDRPEWHQVNPTHWLRHNDGHETDLRVLLLHGDSDEVVPVSQTTDFATELTSAGVDTTTVILPGLGHLDLFLAANAGPPIQEWLDSWPRET